MTQLDELCLGPAVGMNQGGNLLFDGSEKRRVLRNAANNKCSKTPAEAYGWPSSRWWLRHLVCAFQSSLL